MTAFLVMAAPAAAALPDAFTSSAANQSTTTTLVSGAVNTNGEDTTARFDYDVAGSAYCVDPPNRVASYHKDIPGPLRASGSQDHVSATLASLSPGTSYCVTLTAMNGSGASQRPFIVTFTAGAPRVGDRGARSLDATTVRVSGVVDEFGVGDASHQPSYRVTYWAAQPNPHGPQCFSGATSSQTPAQTFAPTDGDYAVSVDIGGLSSGSDMCFVLTATNTNGTTTVDHPRLVKVGSPDAYTEAAPATVDSRSATIIGGVDPNGQTTTYRVDYDAWSSEWCQSYAQTGVPAHSTPAQTLGASDATFHDVSIVVSGLDPSTHYCGRIVARTAAGGDSLVAGQADFTTTVTPPPPPPTPTATQPVQVVVSPSGGVPQAAGSVTSGPHAVTLGAGNTFTVGTARCASTQACQDQVTATGILPILKHRAAGAKAKPLVVAHATFAIPAGTKRSLKLKLSKKALAALRKAKKLKLVISTTLTSPGHAPVTKQYTITLRLLKTGRKH